MESIIKKLVTEALTELGISEVDFVVEHPADISHGDYATNAALMGAKQAGKNPREFAEDLVRCIEARLPENLEKVETAGPGFINFTLSRNFLSSTVSRILSEPEDWGKNTLWKEKTVLVEYTDPNPFKEFHVGHLFTNTVGESLARLFMMAGADTKRVNYQSDVGMHVACAIYGMQELGFAGVRDFSARELGKAYALGATALKESEDAAECIKTINKAVYERSDDVINDLYDNGRAVSLTYFDEVYALLGTQFDHMFFESEAAPKGKALVLEREDIFIESDGARVFQGEQYGLHTRVFLNGEGLPTYEAKELALVKMKDDVFPEYDHSVVSTANEITEYFKVLKKAMEFVYPELAAKTEHIGHGTVRLPEGKMSSRTGNIIGAVDFINEIAAEAKTRMETSGHGGVTLEDETLPNIISIAAIKYEILKSNIHQDTVFEKDQALSFEGDSGPYLQYTHARIQSVLLKAEGAGVEASVAEAPEVAYEVEKLLYRFPGVIEKALHERAPHYVAQYLTELAGAFNTFYAHEKIADESDQYAPYKAALTQAVGVTLHNGLWTLGIKAPERM